MAVRPGCSAAAARALASVARAPGSARPVCAHLVVGFGVAVSIKPVCVELDAVHARRHDRGGQPLLALCGRLSRGAPAELAAAAVLFPGGLPSFGRRRHCGTVRGSGGSEGGATGVRARYVNGAERGAVSAGKSHGEGNAPCNCNDGNIWPMSRSPVSTWTSCTVPPPHYGNTQCPADPKT